MAIVNKHHFQWLQEAQARLIDSFPEATTHAGLDVWRHKYLNGQPYYDTVSLTLSAFADHSSDICTNLSHELTAENTDIGNAGRSAVLRKLIQQLKDELSDNIANLATVNSVATVPATETVAPALPEPPSGLDWPDGGH